MIKNKSKGFTIIELLVVVAIIAVLAAIVLVNVTSYIAKGKDAAIKGNLATLLVNAAVYYDSQSPSTYANFVTGTSCNTGDSSFLSARAAAVASGGTVTCPASTATAFCVRSTLNAGGDFCVDYTGYKGTPTGAGDCVGNDFTCQSGSPASSSPSPSKLFSFVNTFNNISDNSTILVKESKKVVEIPEVSVTTKIISTIGVVIGSITTVLSAIPSFSFSDFSLSLVRLMGGVLTVLGIRKRITYWGVVYDFVTKQPLDPAQVILKDLQGNDIASVITDIDGRFGFLVEPGSYILEARKTNYSFPSKKLMGRKQDEVYNNIYSGEAIQIKEIGEIINQNIPLDPIKFDWNEFAKKNKTFMKFYSKWDLLIRKVSDLFFGIGFIVSVVAFILAPYPYNTIILVAYLILLLLKIFGLKPKSIGYVINKATGVPLSFAVLRIMLPLNNIEVGHKITDIYGRYYCLIPKGKYYIVIEKKNLDGSYSLAYASNVINVSKNGILKKRFLV